MPDERRDIHELPRRAGALLASLRQRRPRVHCITNGVAQNFTANVLLAAGALPSMTISADEIVDFVGTAEALLVNLGTFDAERRAATEAALEITAEARIPWVLDPVFIDRSAPRAAYARKLMEWEPDVVRLNAREFATLSGTAADEPGAPAAFALAEVLVLALTGAVDEITDGVRRLRIANGHPLMGQVTAMGCAGSALLAGFLAIEDEVPVAAASALLVMGVAGEIAGESARGPGSFVPAFLDALHALDDEALMARGRVS